MSFVEFAESRTRALTIWDTGLLKTYCVLFGMIVGAYTSSFVMTHLSWFLVGVLLPASAYGYRWLTVKATRP